MHSRDELSPVCLKHGFIPPQDNLTAVSLRKLCPGSHNLDLKGATLIFFSVGSWSEVGSLEVSKQLFFMHTQKLCLMLWVLPPWMLDFSSLMLQWYQNCKWSSFTIRIFISKVYIFLSKNNFLSQFSDLDSKFLKHASISGIPVYTWELFLAVG